MKHDTKHHDVASKAPTRETAETPEMCVQWQAERETLIAERDHERHEKETVAEAMQAYSKWSKVERSRLEAEVARLTSQLANYAQSFSLCEIHTPDLWEGDGTCVICEGSELDRKRKAAEAQLAGLRAALRAADMFISNGIALGFIRMPDDDCPDPAKAVPGMIRAALSAVPEAPARFDPSNHHNALTCPYCNPNRWTLSASPPEAGVRPAERIGHSADEAMAGTCGSDGHPWTCNCYPDAGRAVSTETREKCVIGEYCRSHNFIHGAEAEELRERFTALCKVVKTSAAERIQEVLEDVDARDSAAFLSAVSIARRDADHD